MDVFADGEAVAHAGSAGNRISVSPAAIQVVAA
jgi:hypothetical protein